MLKVVGVEFYLANGVVVYEFSIAEYRELANGRRALGYVKIKDYLNHQALATYAWEAEGFLQDDGNINWCVVNTNNRNSMQKFTGLPEVDHLLSTFIVDYLPHSKLPEPVIIKLPSYHGPFEVYTGPCVCNWLTQDLQPPHPAWLGYMNSGHYPARCFRCSCHTRWWQPSPNSFSWYKVPEDSLWRDLLQHNGCCGRAIILLFSPKEARWLEFQTARLLYDLN
jgi:hypothetical protein